MPPQHMTYMILTCPSVNDLAGAVNMHLQQGWICTGGVVIEQSPILGAAKYHQAMILIKSPQQVKAEQEVKNG